jgi:hypothetical protein
MVNRTNVKVPAKYVGYIDEIQKASKEDKGYWLFAKTGFYISHEDYGVNIGRYDTQKELLDAIRSIRKEDE